MRRNDIARISSIKNKPKTKRKLKAKWESKPLAQDPLFRRLMSNEDFLKHHGLTR